MTHHWLVALVGILLCTASAIAENPPKAKGDEDAAHDAAVLEAVLVDLLSQPDSPVEPRNQKEKKVIFSTAPLLFTEKAASLLNHDKKQWEKVSKEQLAGTHEAADHLIQRSHDKDLFKVFTPKDKRITMYTKEMAEAEAKKPQKVETLFGPQVFSACTPGYSKDRQIAIVHLSFGWSGNFHSAEATIMLARQKDEWVVVVRDFSFYV